MNFRQIQEYYTNTWIWYELLPNLPIKNYLSYWGKLKKNLNKILKNWTISSIHSRKKEGRKRGKKEGKKDRKTQTWLRWQSKILCHIVRKENLKSSICCKKKKNQWPKIIKQDLLNKCHFPTRYHDDLNWRCRKPHHGNGNYHHKMVQ